MAVCLKNPTRAKRINPRILRTSLLLCLIVCSCAFGQRKTIATSSDTVAVFYIKKSADTPLFLEADTWLPIASTVFSGAAQDSIEKNEFSNRLQKLFRFTGVTDSVIASKDPVRIFTEEETSRIGALLFEAEIEIPDGLPKAYQIVVKREDPIRPGLRIRRTVFYLRNQPDCLVLEFSEIGQVVDFQTPYSFRDWTLAPISEPKFSEANSIFLPELRPEGLEYLNSMSEEKKNRICVHPSFWTSPIPKPDSAPPARKTQKGIEERLRTLKELLDKGLISKPDYEKKKAEILKEL
ncbi:hypothetical protein CH371_02535 [Leptospira wolffii]|uniref:SHOCT domain-containing protein n=1 Tax=Leptospira wolffii TaxID=409998 RepID=A0A2M9ZF03_9LEPT|nr:SHOCT domain-containing protein [Leptospira wolffii]PJZ66983.1 hypothetical protein CH371_02535 [Leptospira wolffii]